MKQMRTARKLLGVWLIIFTMIAALLPAVPVSAAPGGKEDESTVDFVLLLDCSGTMRVNDPKGWTATAARNFVDLIGVENARLSVIAFGEKYNDHVSEYGSQDPNSVNRVTVSYELQDVTDAASKTAAKKAIDGAIKGEGVTSKDESMTPIGYALQEAVRVLKEGGSRKDQAAIILLSDGQVDGQTDFVNKGSDLDYKSIDTACDSAADQNWPVYAMELNFKNENKKGTSGYPAIAYHQMRENIPNRTGTEPIEVTSVEKANAALQEIYARFFNSTVDTGTLKNGEEAELEIEEMTAEYTITLSGDISKLDSIKLVSPDQKTEEYQVAAGDKESLDRRITFDENSAVLKLIMPEEGTWTLTTSGSGDVKLDYLAVSLREMNLNLTASDDGSDAQMAKGATVEFTAQFVYNDIVYESESFFNKYPAKLYVNGKEVADMTATSTGYTGSYTFTDVGSYDIYAQVDSSFFREGSRKSGVYKYNIDHLPTTVKNPDQDVVISAAVHETADAVDLNDYFENKTADSLNFTVEKNTHDDFSFDVSKDGTLTLTAGDTSSAYVFTVTADDGTGETGAELPITFDITNSLVGLASGVKAQETVILSVGEEKTLLWSDYFVDPDGTVPEVRVIDDNMSRGKEEKEQTKQSIRWTNTEEGLNLAADESGSLELTVVAVDGNDSNAGYVISMTVLSQTALQALFGRYKVPIILLLLVVIILVVYLILNVTGRKIYGTWDIEVSDGNLPQDDVVLGNLRSAKGSKASLNRVLNDLGYQTGFPNVEFVMGSRFNKKVSLKGLKNCDAVIVDGIQLEEEELQKLEKTMLDLTVGKRVELSKDGLSVVMERRKTSA